MFYLAPRARSFREILTTRATEATRGLSGICQTQDGGIWVSHHGRGIFSLPDPANLTQTKSTVEPISNGIVEPRDLIVDRDGGMWIVSYTRGISRIAHPAWLKSGQAAFRKEAVAHFDQQDQLTDDAVYSAFQDREGNIWFGTRRGLDRFRRRNVVLRRFSVVKVTRPFWRTKREVFGQEATTHRSLGGFGRTGFRKSAMRPRSRRRIAIRRE